jgi:hypothetical protein
LLSLPAGRRSIGQASPTASPMSPTSPHASPLVSPFLLCVGDDRSDEDMFRALHRYDDIKEELAEKSPTSHRSTSSSGSTSGRHSRRPSADMDSTTISRRGRRVGSNTPIGGVVEPGTPLGGSSMNNMDDESKIGKFDPNTYTCCVGIKPSCARFYLRDHDDVAKLLAELATCSDRMNYSKSRHLATSLSSPIAVSGAYGGNNTIGLHLVTTPTGQPADAEEVAGAAGHSDARGRRDDKRPAPVELPSDQFTVDEPRAWPATESAFVRQFATKGAAAYDRETEPSHYYHHPIPSPQSATPAHELGDDLLPSHSLSLSPSASLSSFTPAPSSPKGIQTITAEGLKSSLGALSGSRTGLSSMLQSSTATTGGGLSSRSQQSGGLGGFSGGLGGMSTSRSTGGLADLVRKRHATNDDDFSDDDDDDY